MVRVLSSTRVMWGWVYRQRLLGLTALFEGCLSTGGWLATVMLRPVQRGFGAWLVVVAGLWGGVKVMVVRMMGIWFALPMVRERVSVYIISMVRRKAV